MLNNQPRSVMRNSLRGGLVAAASVLAFAVGSNAAYADSITGDGDSWSMVTQPTATGSCSAEVFLAGTNFDYAEGDFSNSKSGFNCAYWLERGDLVNGSVTDWAPIGAWSYSSDIILNGTVGDTFTGEYWDGPGLRVRACFYMYNSTWRGANHCSNGV
jgi:hypothetical protein